jgi:ADP-ribose pyrophosphatase
MNHHLSANVAIILKQRRTVFSNSRFMVYCDHIAEGNLEVEDFLVVAPHVRRDELLTGVAVIPIRAGSILLLKHYRHAVSEPVWELPRGFMDEGECPAEAVVRELTEESGLICPSESLVALGTFFPDPGLIRARVALFAALECRDGGSRMDDEIGIRDRSWHSEEQVRSMLRDCSIQDGATCVALHRFFDWRREGQIE